jgi:hypothetical protein
MNQIFHLKMVLVYLTLASSDNSVVEHLPHYSKAKGSNLATSGKVHSLLPISMKKKAKCFEER